MSGSRGRRLSDGERVLWREITRGIQPMRPLAVEDIEAESDAKASSPPVIATAPSRETAAAKAENRIHCRR